MSLNRALTAGDAAGGQTLAFEIVLEGELPMSGGLVQITCPAVQLTRAHLSRARAQLEEALRHVVQMRLSRPAILIRTEGGEVLRRTRLMEMPDRAGYLAQEVRPDQGAGQIAEWLAGCVIDFGRKRTVEALAADAT